MNKKVILVILIVAIVASLVGFKIFFAKSPGVGGLQVNADPISSVFIDEKLIGKTPFEQKHAAGEYAIKLIPDGDSNDHASWQGKIIIRPSVFTYVNRSLGQSELKSAGEILQLEKIEKDKAEVQVTSQPDSASVVVDGQDRGTTPLTLKDLTLGEHELAVLSPGFATRSVRIQITSGYRLTVSFQLALLDSTLVPTVSVSPVVSDQESSASATVRIVIKDTPTGFLRVRETPSTAATEVAQIKPGDRFILSEEKDGWYKIMYEQGKEGWISGRYASKE